MTSSTQRPDPSDAIEHPSWCSQTGCGQNPSEDIVHRQMPAGPIVSADRQHMTLTLIQCDELAADDGRQIAHAPEGIVTLGDACAVFNIEGIAAIRDQAAALVEHLRQLAPVSSEAS